MTEVLEGFLPEEEFEFSEDPAKTNQDKILLSLVAHRESNSNGKQFMDDLARVFDTELSPGTVYPLLHDLEEEGVLNLHELVRTKEYHTSDEETSRERIAEQMRQHLTLGMYYSRALNEL